MFAIAKRWCLRIPSGSAGYETYRSLQKNPPNYLSHYKKSAAPRNGELGWFYLIPRDQWLAELFGDHGGIGAHDALLWVLENNYAKKYAKISPENDIARMCCVCVYVCGSERTATAHPSALHTTVVKPSTAALPSYLYC